MSTTARYMNVPTVITKIVISGTWSLTDSNTVILLTIHVVPVVRASSITRSYEGIETPTNVQGLKEVNPQNIRWHYLWKHWRDI